VYFEPADGLCVSDDSIHFAKHTKYAHTKYASKHAKLTGGEPTNIPYAATKAKLSLSIHLLDASSRFLDSPL